VTFYARKKYMQNNAALTQLKTQFNRLSPERQAEILGMAKALTYAQQSADFDLQAFVREITEKGQARTGGENKPQR
jgi:hypothetical protein